MSTLRLDKRVALITGATRGIGKAIAERLAAHGADVVITGQANAASVVTQAEELCKRFGVSAFGAACDVASPSDVALLYKEVFARFKRLDILVNNAGMLGDGLIGMVPDVQVERVLAVNVAGQIRNLQLAARLMQRGSGGAIVNLTSIMGLRGAAGQMLYAASKSAIIGLTLSAAKELGSKGIRVNAVAPGFIDTHMIAAVPAAIRQERIRATALGRPGTANEVADAVLFLVSDLSHFITGQVLSVDGGMVI
jgi:3-oxoacyl-[acyl-carrier protein] reductase